MNSDFDFCDRFRLRLRACASHKSRTVLFPGDDATPISSAHDTAGYDIRVLVMNITVDHSIDTRDTFRIKGTYPIRNISNLNRVLVKIKNKK